MAEQARLNRQAMAKLTEEQTATQIANL